MTEIVGLGLQVLNVAFVGGIFFKLGAFDVEIKNIIRRLTKLEGDYA